jgi:hypothetical protein
VLGLKEGSMRNKVPCFLLFVLLLTGCGTLPTAPAASPAVPAASAAVPAVSAPPPASPAQAGATYYVRTDGGSAAECTGLADAPYPGSGTGQPCAWNHPFQALPPGGPPRISGGDTLLIAGGAYMMGLGAPGADNPDFCSADGAWECHMPPVPGGPDATHPTRILGAGWDSGCSHPPQLWGTERSNWIVDLSGSSNVEIACLELTDHSGCVEEHSNPQWACQRDTPPFGPWAATGIYAQDSANVTLRDLDIHGLAHGGVWAGRLRDWTVERVRIAGNGLVGWDGDIEGDDSVAGTMTFRHWTVEWNGCGETYPGGEPGGCWGQEAGGYGDGIGTGTTGGHWVIEDSSVQHNAQDGIDLLYARLVTASIEIRRTVAADNAGNQIKMSGEAVLENSIVVGHCGSFDGLAGWNSDDSCRAGGDALVLMLQPGGQARVVNSTLTGEGTCLIIAGCALDQTCNGSEVIQARNDIFQGQANYFDPYDTTCFAWYDDESSPPMPADPFQTDHAIIIGTKFGNVDPCAGDHVSCGIAPGLVDPAPDSFDAHLLAGSPAIDAGTTSGAPADDFDGRPRDALPDIGAYEWRQVTPMAYLPLTLRSYVPPAQRAVGASFDELQDLDQRMISRGHEPD